MEDFLEILLGPGPDVSCPASIRGAVLQRGRLEFVFELTDLQLTTERLLRSAGYGQDLLDLERILKIAGAVHLCG
jgi:hypothetical protein